MGKVQEGIRHGRELSQLPGQNKCMTFLLSAALGRSSFGIVPFGVILLFETHHRYVLGGIASAGMLAGTAFLAPRRGRLLDNFSAVIVLACLTGVYVAAGAGIAVFGATGVGAYVSVACAVVMGCSAPPVSAFVRTLWSSDWIPEAERRRWQGYDSVMEEAVFVITPLITVGIAGIGSIRLAIICGTLLVIPAVLQLSRNAFQTAVASSRVQAGKGPRPKGVGLRAIIVLAGPTLVLGGSFGLLGVWIPALVQGHHGILSSGPLLSLLSVGGLVGGLIDNHMPAASNIFRRYLILFVVFAAPLALFSLSGSGLVFAGCILFVSGLAVTPIFTAAYLLVPAIAAPETLTEANSYVGSGFNIGSAGGALAVGFLVEAYGVAGGRWAALTLSVFVVGGLAFLWRSRSVRPMTSVVSMGQD